MINIKHDDFGKNYELFARLCEITSEPVRITKAGAPDIIAINADAYMRRKKMLFFCYLILLLMEANSSLVLSLTKYNLSVVS